MGESNRGMYQQVRFHRYDNEHSVHYGYMVERSADSCTIEFLFEGTWATMVCFYDTWSIHPTNNI